MKIIHLLSSNSYSGAENVVIQIIKMFEKSDIDMVYISKQGSIEEILKKNNIRYILLNKMTFNNIKKILEKENPDIIHAHDFRMSIISSFFCQNYKIISHIHHNAPWLGKPCFKSFLYFVTTNGYKKILVVSEAIKKEYIYAKYLSNKIVNVSNPLNREKIIKRAESYDTNECNDLLFMGRITEAKNPELMIDIIKKLVKVKKDIKIGIIGDGDKYEFLKKNIENIDSRNIKLYGFLNNPYPILKKAKVLCMPSKWEGFGLVAYESICLATPVVCSGKGGLKDIINNKCGKICHYLDEYVEEILKLLSDNNYYIYKCKNAVNKSITMDNYNNYRKEIFNCYSECIDTGGTLEQ